MDFLYTILYILLFIFCLSVLIVIHELGHFATAKFFKVYCEEFSIGFGPALFRRKRANGETYFAFRALPFGGYVSMYGEGAAVPEGVESIDPSRSFSNIARWKKIIILFAGVFNNAVLALLLFFVSNSCFIQKTVYLNYVGVEEGSIAEVVAKIKDQDYISLRQYKYTVIENNQEVEKLTDKYVIDNEAKITVDGVEKDAYVLLGTSITSYSNISYDSFVEYYPKKADGTANLEQRYLPENLAVSKVSFVVTTAKKEYKQYINSTWKAVPGTKIDSPTKGEAYYQIIDHRVHIYVWSGTSWNETENVTYTYEIPLEPQDYALWCDLEAEKTAHPITLNVVNNQGERQFEKMGLSYLYDEYWNEFPTALGKTFTDWGNSATVIVRSFISLFTTPETWKDVGGIIAIGVQSSNILQNMGVAKFIYLWGLLSVNLAIVNLFPFPGLDGWQILVLVVEGVFRKQIPEKVKAIVSFVGIALLMALMVLILVKDFIGLF